MKWLMDTGCGHDLIGRAKAKSLGVDIVKDDDEIVFQTANGSTSTSDVAKIVVAVEPHVLDETPNSVVDREEMHENGLCVSLDAW